MWGALLGCTGLLTYRAVNTLDDGRPPLYPVCAVRLGHPTRLDDMANWAPSRLAALLAVAAAPLIGGDPRRVAELDRDGQRHQPDAGQCEPHRGARGAPRRAPPTAGWKSGPSSVTAASTAADIHRAINLSGLSRWELSHFCVLPGDWP